MIVTKTFEALLAPTLVALSLTGDVPSPIDPTTTSSNAVPPTTRVSATNKSPTEDYLPRRLYPGTYQNYCGPTPEVDRVGGCVAHGWHGDDALDSVDAACRLHDVSYCQCESELLQRRHAMRNEIDNDESIPMLSALTALRFATRPAMNSLGVDQQYYQCINKADRQLIATGLEIRGQQQRTACGTDPALAWFCGKQPSLDSKRDTLAAFEKVSLNIFLRSLDDDDQRNTAQSSSSLSLSALEKQRRLDLQRELQSGKTLAEAAASDRVVQDEAQMIQRLTSTADAPSPVN